MKTTVQVEKHDLYTYVRCGNSGAMLGSIFDDEGYERPALTLMDYTQEHCPVRITFCPDGDGVRFDELYEALTILRAEVAARMPRTVSEYVAERGLGELVSRDSNDD